MGSIVAKIYGSSKMLKNPGPPSSEVCGYFMQNWLKYIQIYAQEWFQLQLNSFIAKIEFLGLKMAVCYKNHYIRQNSISPISGGLHKRFI